jgi:hypothetical protein
MGLIIAAGNLFLRYSRSRIRMFTSWRAWRDWEISSFVLLHGSERAAFAAAAAAEDGVRRLYTRALPGESLKRRLASGGLTVEMLRAAGEELRRAHGLISPVTGEPWSHGDPHLDNMLYDPVTQRARLIDFETLHEAADARTRHADDLLVLLLDLLGRARGKDWILLAGGFLEGYGQKDVIMMLPARLHMPAGLERVLWATRTDFAEAELLRERVDELRQLAGRMGS